MALALQPVHRRLEMRREFAHAADRILLHEQVERRDAGRTRDRVRRVRVAVRKLEHVFGAAGGHERVVDVLLRDHGAERLRAVGHLLRDVQDVRRHAERFRARQRAGAAEARDDLVEDQQDVVRGADLAQALQIALRRHDDARRARERLDDHRRDVRRVVQRDQVEQAIGQLGAVFRHAARERVLRELRVRQEIGVDALAEQLAVRPDAADRDAAEVHAVVALLAADQARLGALALRAPVRARQLQRRIGRFRARTREEHVVEAGRRQVLDLVRELERLRVAVLERRRVVELRDLAAHRFGDLGAAVAEARAPEARQAVVDLAAFGIRVIRALGRHDHARIGLELSVGGERHPVRVEPRGIGAQGRVVLLCSGEGVGHMSVGAARPSSWVDVAHCRHAN